MKAFHLRRYGSRIKIEDYIVNYDTLTKMTRGHTLDLNKVIPSIVSITSLTTNTGPKAKASLKDSVVVVNLSRAAALSATLPSSSVLSEISEPSCLINLVFNSTSTSQSNTSVVNITSYDTIVDTGASAHVVKSTQLATKVRTLTNRHVALGDNSIKQSFLI